ncbi:VQ motif-containing protein 31-like [Curcuma longa]|uniref:VQ motif-containing protein 31-like n=1 Tax=Curcuma longa TaxID=136217 RepID=UPI003D9F0CDC
MEKPPSAPSLPSTTFVQADAAIFKELVQRLTGPPPQPNSPAVDSAAKLSGVKRLHERRRGGSGGSRLKLAVHKPAEAGAAPKPASPAAAEEEEVGRKEVIVVNEEEEEQAIKERRFYLHPSPRSRTRMMPQPDLLPLFPLTSPKAGEQ